jgi:hypothetical protein
MAEPLAVLEGRAHVLRRNWIFPGVGAASVLAMALGALKHQPSAILGWFAAAYLGAFGLLTLSRNALRLRRRVTYRASSVELVLSDRPAIPAADILEAKTIPRPGRIDEVDVDLMVRGRGSVTLRTSEAEASQILDVLRVGVGQRRASFTTIVPFAKRFLPVFAFGVALAFLMQLAEGVLTWFSLVFTPFYVALPCLAVAALIGLWPGKVVVGADGFTVRWVRRRFVPFDAVRSVEGGASAGGVATDVRLNDGRSLRLVALDTPDTEADRGASGRALLRHLSAAFRRHRMVATTAEATMQLQRGQRTARDWLAGLDALVPGRGGGAGYRTAALSPDLLTDVTSSQDGAADVRVGAAAALVRIGGADNRATVRIAAEACAEPEARAALLGLAEAETDEQVEAALRRFSGS